MDAEALQNWLLNFGAQSPRITFLYRLANNGPDLIYKWKYSELE